MAAEFESLDSRQRDLQELLNRANADLGGKVTALYCVDPADNLVPIALAGHKHVLPQIAGTSDMGMALHRNGTDVAFIKRGEFRDAALRSGFDAFDISAIEYVTVPVPNETSHYYMTVGLAGQGSTTNPQQHQLMRAHAALIGCFIAYDHASTQLRDSQYEIASLKNQRPNDSDALSNGILTDEMLNSIFEELIEARSMTDVLEAITHQTGFGTVVESDSGRVLESQSASNDSVAGGVTLLRSTRYAGIFKQVSESGKPYILKSEPDGESCCIIGVLGAQATACYLTITNIHPIEEQKAKLLSLHAGLALSQILRRHDESRREALRHLFDVSEAERVKVSSELHDMTSQDLVALKVNLNIAQADVAQRPNEADGVLEECQRIADGILMSVNRVSDELRPSELEYLGLGTAISAYARYRLDHEHIFWRIEGNALETSYDSLLEIMLLRIAQEAISNCARHSGADGVTISLDSDGSDLELMVTDDGRGFELASLDFDDPKVAIGIKSMRGRVEILGGKFWMGSEPGSGTTVIAKVPVASLHERTQ